ncbi:MAG TPA: hypothetical protein VGM10_16875 [Actinocrinis sp.]
MSFNQAIEVCSVVFALLCVGAFLSQPTAKNALRAAGAILPLFKA